MLTDHKDLLAAIELAEEGARRLYGKGARIEGIVRGLRQAGRDVKDRIAHYTRDAKAAKAAKAGEAAPGPAAGTGAAMEGGSGAAPERQRQQQQQTEPPKA